MKYSHASDHACANEARAVLSPAVVGLGDVGQALEVAEVVSVVVVMVVVVMVVVVMVVVVMVVVVMVVMVVVVVGVWS